KSSRRPVALQSTRPRAFLDRRVGELRACGILAAFLLAGALPSPALDSRGQPSSARTSPRSVIGGASTAFFGGCTRRVAGGSSRTSAAKAALSLRPRRSGAGNPVEVFGGKLARCERRT